MTSTPLRVPRADAVDIDEPVVTMPRTSALYQQSTLELLHETPGVASFHAYNNLALLYWQDAATLAAVEGIREAAQSLLDSGVQHVSAVHWLTADRPMPDAAARSALVDMMRSFHPVIACTAVVLNGGGFWASAIRATINGIRILVPGRIDLRVDESLEATAAWLPEEHTRRTGVPLTATELRVAIRAVVGPSA